MMKPFMTLAFLSLAILCGCVTSRGPVVRVTEGITAATPEQQAFLQKVSALPAGASQQAVREALGDPVMSNKTNWFYELRQDPIRGGYYVAAALVFNEKGLVSGNVTGGHTKPARRIAPRP